MGLAARLSPLAQNSPSDAAIAVSPKAKKSAAISRRRAMGRTRVSTTVVVRSGPSDPGLTLFHAIGEERPDPEGDDAETENPAEHGAESRLIRRTDEARA